jgi:hypothetical protein
MRTQPPSGPTVMPPHGATASPALARMAPAYTFLLERGFSAGTDAWWPLDFGAPALLMVGAPFSLRFEAGEQGVATVVDLGSNALGWHRLEHVLEFVDPAEAQGWRDGPPGPEALAELLQSHWDVISALFGSREDTARLQAYSRRRAAQVRVRLVPSSD